MYEWLLCYWEPMLMISYSFLVRTIVHGTIRRWKVMHIFNYTEKIWWQIFLNDWACAKTVQHESHLVKIRELTQGNYISYMLGLHIWQKKLIAIIHVLQQKYFYFSLGKTFYIEKSEQWWRNYTIKMQKHVTKFSISSISRDDKKDWSKLLISTQCTWKSLLHFDL